MTSWNLGRLSVGSRVQSGAIASFALLSLYGLATASPGEKTCRSLPVCQPLLDRASRLHESGQPRAALTAFQQAFAVSREPRLLINMGRALHHLGRYQEALASYQRYQDLARQQPFQDEEVQDRLLRFVAEARALLPPRSAPPTVIVQPPVVSPSLQLELKPEIKLPELRVQVDLKLPPATVSDRPLEPRQGAPWYRRGWVWASLGGIAATGIGIGVGYLAYRQQFPAGAYRVDTAGP